MAGNKYKNKPVMIDGKRFASMKEGRRYEQLRLMLQYHKIRCLEIQPKYDITVAGVKVCAYRPDFRYLDESGRLVVEDVKSPITAKHPVYRIKKKLLRAIHGVEVVEV